MDFFGMEVRNGFFRNRSSEWIFRNGSSECSLKGTLKLRKHLFDFELKVKELIGR